VQKFYRKTFLIISLNFPLQFSPIFQFQKLIGWLLVTCCVYYTCYRLSHVLLLGYKYNVIEHTEYTIVRPLVWSFALAYLIYMCHTGQAGELI
jgi:hypothetical protein